MFKLKSISHETIPSALQKAERYRLLQEPWLAHSICLDILEIDPENQKALITLLLALTDEFAQTLSPAPSFTQARDILPRLHDDFSRSYYEGIIYERKAEAQLNKSAPRSGYVAYGLFRKAMECYEKALKIAPPGNSDAILRWNTCARIIMYNKDVVPASEEVVMRMQE